MSLFKSLESIDAKLKKPEEPKLSVELYNKLKSSIARALIRSAGFHMYASGDSAETLNKKLVALVNSFISGGDLSKYDDYLIKELMSTITVDRSGRGYAPYVSTFDTCPYSIVEDPYTFVYGDRDNYNDAEKSMVAEFCEARKRYEEISRKVHQYISRACESIRKDLIIKHSSAFEQNAAGWLKEISSSLRLGLPIESKQNV